MARQTTQLILMQDEWVEAGIARKLCESVTGFAPEEYLALNLVFHAPAREDGAAFAIVLTDTPEADEVGLQVEQDDLQLRLIPAAGTDFPPEGMDHGFLVTSVPWTPDVEGEVTSLGEVAFASPWSEQELTDYRQAAISSGDLSVGESLLLHSRELDAWRLIAFRESVKDVMLTYRAAFGEWPTDWHSCLAGLSSAPLTYVIAQSQPELPLPDGGVRVGVHPGMDCFRVELWCGDGIFSAQDFQYSEDPGIGRVGIDPSPQSGQTPDGEFNWILATQL